MVLWHAQNISCIMNIMIAKFHVNNVCGLRKNCLKYTPTSPSIACEMELKVSTKNKIKLLHELWEIASAN